MAHSHGTGPGLGPGPGTMSLFIIPLTVHTTQGQAMGPGTDGLHSHSRSRGSDTLHGPEQGEGTVSVRFPLRSCTVCMSHWSRKRTRKTRRFAKGSIHDDYQVYIK